MKQMTFASLDGAMGFERFGKTTKRAKFLAEMDAVVPWAELAGLIEPHYPKAGNGRPPTPLMRMLRIHLLQLWFNLSDPGAEEALYDSPTMRAFAGIDLGREPVPDETTILNFRHLLETHDLATPIFNAVQLELRLEHLIDSANNEVHYRFRRVPYPSGITLGGVIGLQEVFVEVEERVVPLRGFSVLRYKCSNVTCAENCS